MQKIEVATKNGKIVAYEDTKFRTPAICIDFIPDDSDKRIPVAAVEYPNDDDKLGIYVYSDVNNENYTHKASISQKNIDIYVTHKKNDTSVHRYFYIIEDLNGKKYVRFEAYVSRKEFSSEENTIYALHEYSGCYMSIDKLHRLITDNLLFNVLDENVKYCSETKESIIDSYFDGQTGSELDINCVGNDTPYGYYYFDHK